MRAQSCAGGLAAAFLLLAATAVGEPLPAGLTGGTPAQIVRVLDGETARLADGSELRLAAILAPKATPPRAGQTVHPERDTDRLSDAARAALATRIEGKQIVLHFAGMPSRDRHGRQIAYVADPAGDWVQAALVAQGLARVQTSADHNLGAAALLRLEATAREQRLGLWHHESFRVRSPKELGRWIETFQIVEGMAVTVAGARPAGRLAVEADGARLALNLSTRARTELRALQELDGRPIRVRGWVRWQGGPVIDVTHAAAIELVQRAGIKVQ